MMTAASAAATAAREERDEAESAENANPEEHVAFLAKWNEGKTRATACRCSHICLGSSANISRALLSATAKAAVYQTAGNIFGDPKTAVASLSADLVGFLEGEKGGGVSGPGAAGVLSDLSRNVERWVHSKKTVFGSIGETFGGKTARDDAVGNVEKSLTRGEGWPVADRERVSRDLLLRYDRECLAHCEEAYETPEELLRHKTRCSFRPTQCANEGCVEVFSANVAGGHDACCPFKRISCPQKCGREVPRRLLKSHVNGECERRPAECPFRHLGCEVECTTGTLEAHCREGAHAHLALLATSVGHLRESAAASDAKTNALSVAVADVAGRAASTARQIDGLERASMALEKEAKTATAAARKTEKEHDALLEGVAKAIAALESESKKQRKDLDKVMVAVDRLTRAHESAVREMAVAKK
jgi:hypothetical protein